MSELSAFYDHLTNVSGLTAITSTRIYHVKAPASAARPYVVFSRISKVNVFHQGGAAQFAESTIQVSHVASDPTTAESMATALRQGMDGLRGTLGVSSTMNVANVRLISELDSDQLPEFSTDTGAYMVVQDWRLQHVETAPSV